MRYFITITFIFYSNFWAFGQIKTDDQIAVIQNGRVVEHPLDSLQSNVLMLKSPIRASLYSAVIPGMGQIYNKKWWKAPVVWGLLGTGTGFIFYYNDLYKKYRRYYLAELNGQDYPLANYPNVTANVLAVRQDDYKRYRDYAIAITSLVYLLNIVDATVDAHLYGIKKDKDLALEPIITQDFYSNQAIYGLSLNFKF